VTVRAAMRMRWQAHCSIILRSGVMWEWAVGNE